MATKHRSVLVVGAAGGVGLALTRQLLARDDRIIATVLNPAEAEVLRAAAPDLDQTLILDLADPQRAAATLREHVQTLDAVVVCAAIGPVGPLETLSLATLRKTLDINSVAGVAVYQACMPLLRKSRGRIVFISSFSGKVALPCLGAYSGSKFALEGLADVMRREAAVFGVDVILIEPGAISTPMVQGQLDALVRERDALSPEMKTLYGPLFETYQTIFTQALRGGMNPSAVAQAVVDALVVEQPMARYVVGDDARYMCETVAAMPDHEADRAVVGFLSSIAGQMEKT